MTDNELGNIFIKHNDKWRGDYYLKDDLSFTINRNEAARFHIIKSGNNLILNKDHVSINLGNKTLIIDNNDNLRLLAREYINMELSSFIINNGTDDINPIAYESQILFILNERSYAPEQYEQIALKYEWGMDTISENLLIPEAVNYKPKDHPNLIKSILPELSDSHINSFKFILENADIPITHSSSVRNSFNKSNRITEPKNITGELFEGYRGVILILLLMIVLVLSLFASK